MEINIGILMVFLSLLIHPTIADGFISRRAKCAIECYVKCANSGTPKAVYCHCPLNVEADPCNSVTEQLLAEKTVERQVQMDSGYKDIRTIWLRVEPVPDVFINIFEYSIQSTDRPIWTFAGASSSPQITFSVPDACRDYQFRTIIVLRSTNPLDQLVVFRARPIPAQFPAFTVPNESIHLDRPKESGDGRTLHVSVSWQHPFGYEDTDVYGYSPPTAYPIRCQTPEDRLSSPRLELVQGGARMQLALPAEVLQERCRLYMEVRMLPRCVRIDPFDVQISVELDCQKFPELRYCQKEHGPQCTDVVDLWGKDDGRAIVVWQRPTGASTGSRSGPHQGKPLFYLVSWGTTQSQGSPPFVTHQIVQHHQQLRVPGNQTTVELTGVRPGVQYGLQICGFFSELELHSADGNNNPFRIVPVIPFTCTQCQGGGSKTSESCIDCSKIEESTTTGGGQQNNSPPPPPPPSVHFISADTVILDVFGANVSTGGVTTATMPSSTFKNLPVPSTEETDKRMAEGQPQQRHFKTFWPNVPLALTTEESETGSGRQPSQTPTTKRQKECSEADDDAGKSRWWTTTSEKPRIGQKVVEKSAEGMKSSGKEEWKRGGTSSDGKEMTTDRTTTRWSSTEKDPERSRGEKAMMTTEETRMRDEGGRGRAREEQTEVTTMKGVEGNSGGEQKWTRAMEGHAKHGVNSSSLMAPLLLVSSVGKEENESTVKRHKSSNDRPRTEEASSKMEFQQDDPLIHEKSDKDRQLLEARKHEKSDSFVFGSFDTRKWTLAVPAFFLIGLLFIGLALLLLIILLRRCRHRNCLPGYVPSLRSTRKFTGTGIRMPRGRSVLAARTMANGGWGAAGRAGDITLIGTPTIGIPTAATATALGTSSSSASSSGASSASTATTGDSQMGTTDSHHSSISVPLPHHPANFFADNTARFFMHPLPMGKNVHF